MASCIFSNQSQWSLSIPETHTSDGVVFYDIAVQVGSVRWSVSRRYNEFSQLNAVLVREQGISKDALPPKRYLGNLNPEFVDQRKVLLEQYLNKVFHHLVKTMPGELATFLDLDDHDVMFLIRKIPKKLAAERSSGCPELSILQVHALSARLKLPCPPAEMSGYQHDFCSILEACNRLKALRVEGSDSIRASTDHPPTMDFIPFKSLRHLVLNNVPSDLIANADALRNTLSRLDWVSSGLVAVEDALLCDSVHKHVSDHNLWLLKRADFSNNSLKAIGEAVTLMPNLVEFELNSNRIDSLAGLNSLKNLNKLSLKNNGLTRFDRLKLDPNLECLTWLCLSDNRLSSLTGIELFKNLRFLDISNNLLSEFSEISLVCSLPQLATLILLGNPISSIYDYRVKVLELFDERVNYVSLDHELPSQRELDKVAVLQALRMVKEGRSPL